MDKVKWKPVIVVLGYTRLNSIKRCLNAIASAEYNDEDITLVISIDFKGDQDNIDVLNYAQSFDWKYGEKKIRYFNTNQGLRKHFFQCAELSIKYGAAIILEDDVFVSKSYYLFTQKALEFYGCDRNVLAISLYSQQWDGYANYPFYPVRKNCDVYASQIECSWGECYIGNQWSLFWNWYKENLILKRRDDVPGEIYNWDNSYSKYIIQYIVENKKYYITPYDSFATNFSEIGLHNSNFSTAYQVELVLNRDIFIFEKFDNLYKYDIFFQPIMVNEGLPVFLEKNVCIDFWGIRTDYENFEFCISSKILPYKVVKSYGLALRPWEMNILKEIPGNDIFIYDVKRPSKNHISLYKRYLKIKYNLRDTKYHEAIFYGIYGIVLMCYRYLIKKF